MFNILCCEKNRPRGPVNEVRFIEFLLCVVCLGVVIFLRTNSILSLEAFVVTFGLTVVYIVVTLIDMLVVCAWWPIGWRAWLIFSTVGALFFFVCAGLSITIEDKHYPLYLLMFAVTAIVFLMDGLCILKLVTNVTPVPIRPCLPPRLKAANTRWHSSNEIINVRTRACPQCEANADVRSTPTMYDRRYVENQKIKSSGNITEGERKRKLRSRKYSYMRHPNVSHGIRQLKFSRESYLFRQPVAISYGGTFHVSKDIAPLPSPFPDRADSPCADERNYDGLHERSDGRFGAASSDVRELETMNLTPLRPTYDATYYVTNFPGSSDSPRTDAQNFEGFRERRRRFDRVLPDVHGFEPTKIGDVDLTPLRLPFASKTRPPNDFESTKDFEAIDDFQFVNSRQLPAASVRNRSYVGKGRVGDLRRKDDSTGSSPETDRKGNFATTPIGDVNLSPLQSPFSATECRIVIEDARKKFVFRSNSAEN